MRGRRRSPGPPGPPGGYRRDERRYPTAPRERRRRSISPPDRFRRGGSPPPFKRGRYGRDHDDFFPPPRHYDPGFYGRPSPPPRDGRRDGPRDGPRPYKDFCRTLPDDVTPEEAQREYQQYLSAYWGSEVRADFEAKKNEDWMKRRFDPRRMRKSLEERNEEAQKAAAAFAEALASGSLDPKSDTFNQGAGHDSTDKAAGAEASEGDEEEGKKAADAPEGAVAMEVMWKPERVLADLELSRQLMEKLDGEKGIQSNPLKPPAPQPDGDAAEQKGEEQRAAKQEPEEGKEPESVKEEAEAEAKPETTTEAEAKPEEATAENGTKPESEFPAVKLEKGEYEETIGKLDLQLTYLWSVHAVDYYAGKESADPHEFEKRGTTARTLRGQRPEEGEEAQEAEEKKDAKLADKNVTQVWKKRIGSEDPFKAALQTEKADRQLEDWIEDQVKRIDDNKWGCKLSQKLFVGKDYVLKHIRLKHTEKVEDQRNRILDEIYFDNYKKFREEEQRLMQAEMAKVQQAVQGGLPGAWPGASPLGGPMDAFGGGFGSPAFPGVPGAMRGPPMPRQMVMPGGVMPGPGQMLVLAPGAGPMGPFVSVPMGEGPGGRGGGFRGLPPMRGRGGRRPGPPFPGSAPPGGRGRGGGYFDLDNPSNNRAVLDYGDL